VLPVDLFLHVASYAGWPAGHFHRYALSLLLATSTAGVGFSVCHSLDSLASLATLRHSQKRPPLPLLSQKGQRRLPPPRVRFLMLASHWWCLPQPWVQPGQHSQTLWRLLWVKSAGCLPRLRSGCHQAWMRWYSGCARVFLPLLLKPAQRPCWKTVENSSKYKKRNAHSTHCRKFAGKMDSDLAVRDSSKYTTHRFRFLAWGQGREGGGHTLSL